MIGEYTTDVHNGVSHADLILVLIPLSFIVIYSASVVAFNAQLIAIASASLVCCLFIVDGLFWHTPTSIRGDS